MDASRIKISKSKFSLIVAGLLLVLVLVAYFSYADFMQDRPTLIYFRADL